MASPEQQQQQDSASHGRAVSHSRRQALPRRSTRGPLDGDDPLSASPSTPSPSRQPAPAERLSTPRPMTPSRSPVPQPTVVDRSKKDFSFLQRPDNYHSLPDADIPAAFRSSPHNPPPNEPLQALLHKGHFRPAAIQAASRLLEADRTDHTTIFQLLYIRLTCLQLTHHTDLAAQESKILQDLNDPFYTDPRTNTHLAPWELRVLAVRLQALGFNDWRRGVMGYYELAREARIAARRKGTDANATADADANAGGVSRAECVARLHDLAIRIANALLEIGDDDTAARHLHSLPPALHTPRLRVCLALVYLRLGDVQRARHCVVSAGDELAAQIVSALCLMGDGEYADALELWQVLRNASGAGAEDELREVIVQNLALCLLYVGDINAANQLFTELLSSNKPTQTLLFNLSTITELTADNADDKKRALAVRVAEMPSRSRGWEFATADFKM